MKTILVTGGLGFIGSHLADLFKKEGFRVRVLDLPPRPDDFPDDIEYVEGSVNDRASWQKALQGADYVVHLAAYQGYLNDFSTYFTVNASGTALLYEVIAADNIPVKQVIVASSQWVYGEGKYSCAEHGIFYPDIRPASDLEKKEWNIRCPKDGKPAQILPSAEGDVLMPISPYGGSKMAADHVARILGKGCGIPTTILRFAMVYGAHDAMRELYAKSLNFFTEKALQNEEIPIHEDGNQMRDFIDVRDVGRAVRSALGNEAAFFQILNIGSGRSIPLWTVAEAVCRFVGVSFRPVFKGEFRPFTHRHSVMSIEKAKAIISWEPKYSLDESVKKYVEAAKKFHRT